MVRLVQGLGELQPRHSGPAGSSPEVVLEGVRYACVSKYRHGQAIGVSVISSPTASRPSRGQLLQKPREVQSGWRTARVWSTGSGRVTVIARERSRR